MSIWWGLLGWMLGPGPMGQLPAHPDDQKRQDRIDRAVQQADELERDVFTRRLRDAWQGVRDVTP